MNGVCVRGWEGVSAWMGYVWGRGGILSVNGREGVNQRAKAYGPE